jgi:hypothetical protein
MLHHTEQRRWHLARHGPLHLIRHLSQVDHGHHRAVVDEAAVRRRRLVWVWAALGFLVVLVVVLVLFSYGPINSARNDLSAARTIIDSDLHNRALLTTPTGRAQLESDIGQVSKEAAEATQTLSSSESLRILGYVPGLGTQRNGLIQLAADVERASELGDAMLGSLNHLVATSHGTSVSLPALAGLEFFVVEGHKQMAKLDRSPGGLIGPLGTARTDFDREDTKLLRLLSLSAKTIDFARPFLGADGPQTYLIGGMNNAEMRDSGAVLSLDLLTASNGTFSVAQDATYGDYALKAPAPVTLPAGTESIFGAYLPTENWPNVDATADFALTGQSMQAMWAQATGQHVNGVIGIDVPAVASILKLTGPVLVPGIPEEVGANNVERILLNQEYQGVSVNDPQNSRRDKIAAVVKAAVHEMKQEHVDLDAFANALSKDVQGRHLMVWSDVPSYESGLKTLDAAGTLTTNEPDRTIHIAVENSTADKLDYFLGVAVSMHVSVDASGTALVNTTIKVHNGALPGQPPSYQYGPDGVNAFTPGQYVARIFFWGPSGSQVPGSTSESGLRLTQSHFSLLPQQHNQVSFATVIPHAVVHGRLNLRLVPQARLAPDRLTVTLSAPAWHISGSTHLKKAWVNTLKLGWGLTR